eukprot:3728419-Prymnesium_polylepis.1
MRQAFPTSRARRSRTGMWAMRAMHSSDSRTMTETMRAATARRGDQNVLSSARGGPCARGTKPRPHDCRCGS